jgi:hypothetical protein
MFARPKMCWLETVLKVSDVRLSTRFPASHLFTNVESDLMPAIAMPSLAQTGSRRPLTKVEDGHLSSASTAWSARLGLATAYR